MPTIKCKHLWCGEGFEYCDEHTPKPNAHSSHATLIEEWQKAHRIAKKLLAHVEAYQRTCQNEGLTEEAEHMEAEIQEAKQILGLE